MVESGSRPFGIRFACRRRSPVTNRVCDGLPSTLQPLDRLRLGRGASLPSVGGRRRWRWRWPLLLKLEHSAGRRLHDRQQLHVVAAGRMYDAGRGHRERLQPRRRGRGHQPGGQQYGHQHGGHHDAAAEHQHGYDDYDGAPSPGTTTATTVGRR